MFSGPLNSLLAFDRESRMIRSHECGWAPAKEAPAEVEASVDRDVQRIAHQARGGQG